jgi:RNA polymerase sigma-70 factor
VIRKYLGDAPSADVWFGFVQELHTADLYLGTACAARDEHAWQYLRALHLRRLTHVFRRLGFERVSPYELADNLLTDMFLPDRSGQSRIGSYDGRSSLATWLRVIARHRHINEGLSPTSRACGLVDIPEPSDTCAAELLDAGIRRSRYAYIFARAFRRACGALSTEERQLLLWRFEEGLRLGEIARRVGIHQSNITRRIDRLCGALRSRIIAILEEDHGFTAAAIAECLVAAFDDSGAAPGALGILGASGRRGKTKEVAA